jgi:hypothetical protein
MTIKQWGIVSAAAILALAVSYTAGRFTAPAKVVEKEKVVEVRKDVKVVDQEAIAAAVASAQAEWKKNESVRTVTKVIYKDGKVVEKIVYRDKETQDSGSSSSSSASSSTVASHSSDTSESTVTKTKEKTTEYKTDRYHLSVAAFTKWDHFPTSFGDLKYEGRGEIRILGGLWGGIATIPQDKYAGLTLALQF